MHKTNQTHKNTPIKIKSNNASKQSKQYKTHGVAYRSEFLYRERFNLSAADRELVAGDAVAPVVPAPLGGPFALAWRNYMKYVFPKGFMYRVSCNPSVVLYVAENKTLAG